MKNNLERKVVPIPEEAHPPFEIDFESLITELRELESQPIMGEKEVTDMLLKIDDFSNKNAEGKGDKSHPTLEAKLLEIIFGRIKSECGNGEHIKAFFDHFFSIKFKELRREEDSDLAANFHPLTRRIKANVKTIKDFHPLSMLGELSVYGFSRAIGGIHHEVIHTAQHKLLDDWKKNAKVMAVSLLLVLFSRDKANSYLDGAMNRRREDRVLREAHAYLGNGKFMAWSGENNYSTGYLREIFAKYKLFGRPLVEDKNEIDRMIAASTGIKRLYALGLNDKEIGELIRKSKWNDGISGYDKLEGKVKELTASKNLEEEDVDNLVLADDIKRKIYVNKVRLIAQEEVKRVFDNIPK